MRLGSIEKAAAFLGVSASFFRSVTNYAATPGTPLNEWAVKKYASVRFISRMCQVSEAKVRAFVKEKKLEAHITYDTSNHNNAKGRRAEVFWAGTRGDKILEDCNLTQGSQAPFDYVDGDYGRVNVKSSRMYRYKAQTRKANPEFWKLSTSSLEKADHMAFVLYDRIGKTPLWHGVLKVTDGMMKSKSVTIQVSKSGTYVVAYDK